MESSDKKYSEKEFAEIIKKAAEIQAESGNLAGEQGLGFEELVSVGAELGISADAIRSASLAIRYNKIDRRNWFLGESSTISSTQILDAVIPQKALENAGNSIDAITGENGNTSLADGVVSWKLNPFIAMRRGIDMKIEIDNAGSETHIVVTENLSGAAGGVFAGMGAGGGLGLGLGAGLGIGIAVLSSPLFTVLFPVAALGGFYLGARRIYKNIVRSRRRTLDALAKKIRVYLEDRTNVNERP